jgi:hypothetical protein
MKDGFYLSPSGKMIIEIITTEFKTKALVFGVYKKQIYTVDLKKRTAKRLFGSWLLLGK